MKNHWFVLITIVLALAFPSCETTSSIYEHRLYMLSNAPKPIKVIAVSRANSIQVSITFIDAKGRIFVVVDEGLASLKPGELLY